MSGIEPTKIDIQGIKLISELEDKSITIKMEGVEKGIILDYEIETATPKNVNITSNGINWTDGSNNYTTSLERLSEVQTTFQAVLKPSNDTTLVVNKQLNFDDGLGNIGYIGLDGSNDLVNLVVSGKELVVSTGIGTVTEQFRIDDTGNWTTSGGLTYNNTTNDISANILVGDFKKSITNVVSTRDNTSGTYFLPFVKTIGTGQKNFFIDDNIKTLTYSPAESALSANSFLSLHQLQVFPENTAYTRPNSDFSTQTNKWFGGVLAPNGKIYGIPATSQSVLIIDPIANTTDITTITGLISGNGKWLGGVLAPNGKIYCIPQNATSVLIIDPIANTTDTTISNLGTGIKWGGGVLAPNGKIYGIPANSTSVLIIDPAINTTDITTITVVVGTAKWMGGVLAPNGKIYCIPRNVIEILVIDTETNTTSTIASVSGTNKWYGGVLAQNGKIYGIPQGATSVLVIDTASDTVSYITDAKLNGTGKWVGGILAPDGKIYGMPGTISSILIIDPATDTVDITTITGLIGGTNFWGGVLAPNGRIYGIPSTSTNDLIINTGLPKLQDWMLQAYFNKF